MYDINCLIRKDDRPEQYNNQYEMYIALCRIITI